MNPIARGIPRQTLRVRSIYVILAVSWRSLANTFVQAYGGISATAEILVTYRNIAVGLRCSLCRITCPVVFAVADFSITLPLTDCTPADLSLCHLCNNLLHDPQLFPCFHAFCPPCLGGVNQASGSRVSCPACETSFIVTPGGLESLPGCQFRRKLVKLKEIFGNEMNSAQSCDVCSVEEGCRIGQSLSSNNSTRWDL